MALLKKIKSATLIEVLVATIIIIIIFMIASLILNNLLYTSFAKNTHGVQTRIHEITYKLRNHKIQLPYNESYGDWEIKVWVEATGERPYLSYRAVHKNSKKEVTKISPYESR